MFNFIYDNRFDNKYILNMFSNFDLNDDSLDINKSFFKLKNNILLNDIDNNILLNEIDINIYKNKINFLLNNSHFLFKKLESILFNIKFILNYIYIILIISFITIISLIILIIFLKYQPQIFINDNDDGCFIKNILYTK